MKIECKDRGWIKIEDAAAELDRANVYTFCCSNDSCAFSRTLGFYFIDIGSYALLFAHCCCPHSFSAVSSVAGYTSMIMPFHPDHFSRNVHRDVKE